MNWYALEKVVIDKTRKEQTNEVSPITQVATGSVHFCPFRISTWVLESNEKGGNGKQVIEAVRGLGRASRLVQSYSDDLVSAT